MLVYFIVTIALLAVAMIVAIAIGSTSVAPSVVLRVLLSKALPSGWVETSDISEPQQIVIWIIRAPRVLVAALAGAALAMAGAQMQGLFKNPLASPDIIGTSSGGALGAVIALVSGLALRSLFYLPVFIRRGSSRSSSSTSSRPVKGARRLPRCCSQALRSTLLSARPHRF